MNAISFVKSLFSIRTNKEPQANPTDHNVEAKIIPFGVSGRKVAGRSYDYQSPTTHYGMVTLSMIKQLHSDRIKFAVLSYGAWATLAKAFGTYNKTLGRYARESDRQAFGAAVDEFHAWNSALDMPLDEEKVEDIAIRLTSPIIAKENAETDAIRANALKCSIEEVRERRAKKAKIEQEKREESLKGFLSEVWSGNSMADDPALPGSKVMAKAESTLEWMAEQDWIEPADILIATEDCHILSKLATEEDYGGHEGSRAIDMMLADEAMMHAGGNSGK